MCARTCVDVRVLFLGVETSKAATSQLVGAVGALGSETVWPGEKRARKSAPLRTAKPTFYGTAGHVGKKPSHTLL